MIRKIILFIYLLLMLGQIISIIFAYMPIQPGYTIIFIILGTLLGILAIAMVFIYIKRFKKRYREYVMLPFVIIAGLLARLIYIYITFTVAVNNNISI